MAFKFLWTVYDNKTRPDLAWGKIYLKKGKKIGVTFLITTILRKFHNHSAGITENKKNNKF